MTHRASAFLSVGRERYTDQGRGAQRQPAEGEWLGNEAHRVQLKRENSMRQTRVAAVVGFLVLAAPALGEREKPFEVDPAGTKASAVMRCEAMPAWLRCRPDPAAAGTVAELDTCDVVGLLLTYRIALRHEHSSS
jgi:hypothetical protein